MKFSSDEEKIKVIKILNNINETISQDQISILDWGCPHEPKSLPKGKMAVYIFFYGKECLKVGKIGSKSNARYCSHHYNYNNSESNLSKSILSDKKHEISNLTKENIGSWIKENTYRINILLDEKLGKFILNFVEAYFQVKYKPKYEGH